MVLVGAGNVSHDQLVDLANKQFGGLPKDGANVKQLVSDSPAHFVGSEVRCFMHFEFLQALLYSW